MQQDIYSTSTQDKKIKDCKCGEVAGKKTILSSFVRIGINTEFHDNGVFKNNKACYVDNNFCPQCGTNYREV